MDDVTLSSLTLRDEPLVDELLTGLRSYSMAVDGVTKRFDAAKHFLTALPPGMRPASKRSLLIQQGQMSVGLIDLVIGYPDPGTAFIGLLAIIESRQGKGIGREAYNVVERALLKDGTKRARLAVIESNPVGGFWRKMGFEETGERKPFRGECVRGVSILMEKLLPTEPQAGAPFL